jgi:hypothetical protein
MSLSSSSSKRPLSPLSVISVTPYHPVLPKNSSTSSNSLSPVNCPSAGGPLFICGIHFDDSVCVYIGDVSCESFLLPNEDLADDSVPSVGKRDDIEEGENSLDKEFGKGRGRGRGRGKGVGGERGRRGGGDGLTRESRQNVESKQTHTKEKPQIIFTVSPPFPSMSVQDLCLIRSSDAHTLTLSSILRYFDGEEIGTESMVENFEMKGPKMQTEERSEDILRDWNSYASENELQPKGKGRRWDKMGNMTEDEREKDSAPRKRNPQNQRGRSVYSNGNSELTSPTGNQQYGAEQRELSNEREVPSWKLGNRKKRETSVETLESKGVLSEKSGEESERKTSLSIVTVEPAACNLKGALVKV